MNIETSKFWFIGTGQFAALCLQGLIKNGINFQRIITGLPTRSGRNNRENPSAVELKANEIGLSVSRTGRLTENQELISSLNSEKPDIIFVIDFGQIIRDPFLSFLCLNIHPSMLPEYRGAAPIQRALLDGKTKTGVSVFRLAKAMDAGDILTQSEIEISPEDCASDLYIKLSDLGCKISCDVLKNETLKFTPQDNSRSSYADKLNKDEFLINLSDSGSAENFINRVRALDMSGGAYIINSGKRLKIWKADLRNDIKSKETGKIFIADGRPFISFSDCCVELSEVQSEGKKRMTGREWVGGLRI